MFLSVLENVCSVSVESDTFDLLLGATRGVTVALGPLERRC